MSVPIHKHSISLHLMRSLLISLNNIFQLVLWSFYTFLVKCIIKPLVFLCYSKWYLFGFNFNFLLLIHRKTINLCILTFIGKINSLMNSNILSVESFDFLVQEIMLSKNIGIQVSSFSVLIAYCTGQDYHYIAELVTVGSTVFFPISEGKL